MEAGKVVGGYDDDYQEHFKDTVFKQEFDDVKRYFFSFAGRKDDYEGEPILFVTIHKRTGRIIRGGVGELDW